MNSMTLSPAFCAHNGVVFYVTGDKQATIGMLDVDDMVLRTRIEKSYPGFSIKFESIDSDSYRLQLSRLFSEDKPQKRILDDTQNIQDSATKITIDQIENDAPLINFLNSVFLEAVSKNASDIHIETETIDAQIRFRIDGMLVLVNRISQDKAASVSARLKLLANLNVMELRRPQDGRIDIFSGGFSLDARISITPTVHGESIVLRLLNRTDKPLSLNKLGFTDAHLESITNILGLSSGLILVTGPTGSGKTTTLAAMLRVLNNTNIKIVSIEDPVEYKIEGITQIQTNEELGLTFDTILRRIFRQDPDIIMIGEIRDVQTAELAIRAAMTGHLVFATLHTNNAIESIARMENMGIPSYLIGSVLRSIIGQRLLRRICTSCMGKGCVSCSKTGYSGRIVIAEIVEIDNRIAERIIDNVKTSELIAFIREQKILSMQEDAIEKVHLKITSTEEIKRELGGRF